MLEVSDLHVAYGPIEALHGVSVSIAQGETAGGDGDAAMPH